MGMNTQGLRQAIDKGQFSWLENIMPIGYGNAKVVPAQSAIKTTLTGEAVYYRKAYNISGVDYLFCACTSGAAYQINLSSYAQTVICAAGTFPASGTQIAQWKNERILIINATNYYSWNGAALTVLGGTTSAPTAGQCIATYASRVWISNGRTINYSRAASYTDFSAPGGNTIISDSTLTSDIQQLVSANNFLYFFGEDSINVIADVSVNAAGTVTLFSNTNISANSGSSLPQAIFPYYRAILYMNRSGIFGLYGATPRKASDDLDGLFQQIDFTQPVTGGTVVIYNILCASFMFTYNDPVAGARKLIAIYFNKKWFVASQGNTLVGQATAHTDGSDSLHADDGTNIYALFDNTTSNIATTLKTAFWDYGDFVREKQALKIGVELVSASNVGTIAPTVDTEATSTSPSGGFSGGFTFSWVNSGGLPFTWTNSLAQAFTWLTAGYLWYIGDVQTQGHYLGVTITSSSPQFTYTGIQLQYRMLPGGWWS